MLPAEFPDGSPSSAERKVFEVLASSKIPGVALHSLNLPEHEHKLTAELDFVVLLHDIILAIEVKGGRVAQRSGTWTYTDRYDVAHHSAEGPFKQVTSGMHALRKRVREHLATGEADELAFGTLVVTPDVDLPNSLEWAEDTYIGRGPFSRPGGMDSALVRASSYWAARQPKSQPIGKLHRADLLSLLRPDFERVPNLASVAGRLDGQFARLSAEQLSRLDILMETDRVLCCGGAGTGKTFLAAEVARRFAIHDESTLLVCRSAVLAAYLGARLKNTGVDVRCIDQLGSGRKYKRLLVDEGQDLMSWNALTYLDAAVDGGIENGQWLFFHDPNRQAHMYLDNDPDVLAFLRANAEASPGLRNNCRNTRDIAFNTRAVTGADLGVAAAGSGPKVATPVVSSCEDEKIQLESWLRKLRDDEVPASDITIVSVRGDWGQSSARTLRAARRGQLTILTPENAPDWPTAGLTWASAVNVKGLENRFVAVIDLDDLQTDTSLDKLYVAMSRPRAGLWVAIPQRFLGRLQDLLKVNTKGALEAYGRDE